MDPFTPPETAPAAPSEENARLSAILGIVAMTLNMTACCTSILGVLAGTMCGVGALWLAQSVRQQPLQGEADAYAKVGWWTGLISTIFGAFVLLLVCAYIMLYVGLIGFFVATGEF